MIISRGGIAPSQVNSLKLNMVKSVLGSSMTKETGEYDDRNKLDIQQFVHQTLKVRPGEVFDVVKI